MSSTIPGRPIEGASPTLYNEDLAPTTAEGRTWAWTNIAALWVGMVVCVPTYGHTPGHQSLKVRLDSGEVLLTGDACYLRKTLENLHLPRVVHDREQMLDPELLTLFRAARQSRGNGRDRAHTVGRSNPSTLRPRITSRSFDDLCLLERSASERPPSPVGEARAGKLQRDVLQGFVETVREKPTHPSIPTLAMVCASRSSALSLRSPKMADVFAPTPPTNPTSFKHGPAP